MNAELISKLSPITAEEEEILKGRKNVDQGLYTAGKSFVVDSKRLLEEGKLIHIRPHTRFVHFPPHTHNYVEMIYMCSGSTTHKIGNSQVRLNEGELLILSQNALQEIYPAGENDLAVNFIILPEFFDQSLIMLGTEKNALRDFIVGCLTSYGTELPYLHFKVQNLLPVQNLIENLIWTLQNQVQNKRQMNQITMGLLFLQLMNVTDRLSSGKLPQAQELLVAVLQYVEEHYREGDLDRLARSLNIEISRLSRIIKKQTGYTFTALLQDKRLNQAKYLLCTTGMSVLDISLAVGYDNFSYFHRLFKKRYVLSPGKYRRAQKEALPQGGATL